MRTGRGFRHSRRAEAGIPESDRSIFGPRPVGEYGIEIPLQ
ncbi:hypothetical protein [Glycomyces buryatensis]|nr:hypothetical protein [Glycomyces buryatensis]